MNLRQLVTAASIALLPLTAGAATLILPVAGSANGANGSVWKTDVTLHSTATHQINATLVYHDQSGATANTSVTIPPRGTVAMTDIVRTTFDRPDTLGAIEINVADIESLFVAPSARIYNISSGGQFGEYIPQFLPSEAAKTGDTVVIAGLTSANDFRLNVGLYALTPTTITWQLVHSDGTIAATNTMDFVASQQQQFAATTLFNTNLQDNDVVQAVVTKGSAIVYGSLVNQATGDPSFVRGVRTQQEGAITLLGVDRDQNGTVDIPATDGVLTKAVDAYTLGFPTYFRLIAEAAGNQTITYQIVSSTADARLIDDQGTVQIVASPALQGTTGSVVVSATTPDGQTAQFTIPVKFF